MTTPSPDRRANPSGFSERGAAQELPAEITRALKPAPPSAAIPMDVAGAALDHVGIAVHSLDAALGLYRALGMAVSSIEEVPHERVRVAMLQVGQPRIELLEPIKPESAVGRFLAKRGEGLHHVALRVPDLKSAVERLEALGVRLISETIQIGAGGLRYVFVHPSSANGVLLELVQAPRQGAEE